MFQMARNEIKGITFVLLENVCGHGNRQNDVLFSTMRSSSSSKLQDKHKSHVVFFPGDIQNFYQMMIAHEASYKWSCWSYEDTCALLHHKFIDSYVWLVKPSRIHDQTFSCYDNFLHCNMFGAPINFDNVNGLTHLHNLINTAIDNVNQLHVQEQSVLPISQTVPLVAVGFSKGCVVLNQLVYELEHVKAMSAIRDMLRMTRALYWLDGGHSLTSNVWITEDKPLQQLTDLGVKVRVHVTPRQVKDPKRSFIGVEEAIFVDLLRSKGADVEECLHFADEEPSLEQHFRVLKVF
ncbi:UPF0565 protein C2orf69 homolog [Asterias rubens]|uniref:UPF0565 protein C2orf69 homolog n=1 Tax=Asterias rubens TaxID=7604 RepID=UPI0014555B6F|nr:UPF0565 protein C2orf69 homolog [Asterias rubens]